jgi:hypothetical protein
MAKLKFSTQFIYFGTSLGGVVLLGLLAKLWFSPMGSGEYRESPNQRYTVHASNLNQGTLSGREFYLEITVIENASGKTIKKIIYPYEPSASVPNYGDRSQQFIQSAQDSNSFTVPVNRFTKVTIVPEP